jgi:hypothetical protein
MNTKKNSPVLLSPSRPPVPARRFPLVPLIVISCGAWTALLVWSVPAWNILAPHFTQLPALWEIAANRRTILVLLVKLGSPLLVALLLGAVCWLWALLKPLVRPENEAHAPPAWIPEAPAPVSPVQPDGETPAPPSIPAAGQAQHEIPETANPAGGHPAFPETSFPPTQEVPGLSAASQPLGDDIHFEGETETDEYAREDESQQESVLPRDEGHISTHEPFSSQEHASSASGMAPLSAEVPETAASEPPPSLAPTPSAETSESSSLESSSLPPLAEIAEPYIAITLLKQVTMTLCAGEMSIPVSVPLNTKRVQLLAYIAWQRGSQVQRDPLVEHVFGRDYSDPQQLSQAFDSHKKAIREALRRAIKQFNTQARQEVFSPTLDVFAQKYPKYWLAPHCHVVDLEIIEAEHQRIEAARTAGQLVTGVPLAVKEACEQLCAAYTGDFLEEVITSAPTEVSGWARVPYTRYRDYYLEALWYRAEYELHQGQQWADERPGPEGEARRRKQREHWSQAAEFYKTYAMKACSSRFDLKVTFTTPGGQASERVTMGERALRRCLQIYHAMGSSHLIDQTYATYAREMRTVSAKTWGPGLKTQRLLEELKEHTTAYHFPFPLSVTPHEAASDPSEDRA